VNPQNLPVVSRNKKAWMKSEIWYEYLHQLNTEMRISGRHIIQVTDNCPSHPPVDEPPKNYE